MSSIGNKQLGRTTQGSSQGPKSKKKKSKTRSKKSKATAIVPRVYLSPCATDYLAALTDPFNSRLRASLPCIPDTFDLPSQKFYTMNRGLFVIGTAGVGFIAVAPRVFDNNSRRFIISSGTFTGTTMSFANTTMTPYYSNAQYPYASTSQPLARLVSCGLRVRYVGSELNRGGQCIPVSVGTPQDNLNQNEVAGTLLARNLVEAYPCDRKWHGCVWKPMTPDETAYTLASEPADSGANWKMAAFVTGISGEAYEFQTISFFEATSTPAQKVIGESPSHSDAEGYGFVRDFLNHVGSSEIGTNIYNTGLNYIKENAPSAASAAFTYVTNRAANRLEYGL